MTKRADVVSVIVGGSGLVAAAALTRNDVNARNETPLHGAMYRGGAIALIDFLVERGAKLEGVVNSRGWTPLRIADGVALDGVAFIRYPATAERLREHMRAAGLPVPPVEWDGPGGKTTAARGDSGQARGASNSVRN